MICAFCMIASYSTYMADRSAVSTKNSEPQPSSETATFEGRLEAFDRSVASVQGLVADFEQRKHTPLLKRPIVSRGTVKSVAGRVRWDTVEPAPSTLTMDDQEVRIYYPEAAIVEIYPVSGGAQAASVGPMPRLETIRAQFDIKELPAFDLDARTAAEPERYIALELTPRTAELQQRVKTVRVLLDVRAKLATLIQITDIDDELTSIEFLNPRTDVQVREEDVRLTVPSGTDSNIIDSVFESFPSY